MTKAKRYNIVISEEERTLKLGQIKERYIDYFENVTLNKMQLLVGRFVIEHSEAKVVPCKSNAHGLVLVITDYSECEVTVTGYSKVKKMTVKEAG